MNLDPAYDVDLTSYGRNTDADTEVVATHRAKQERRKLLETIVDDVKLR